MKNLIIIVVILVGGYFSFFNTKSIFETSILFNDTTYVYVQDLSTKAVNIYSYSINGQDIETARETIQIFEIGDSSIKDFWDTGITHVAKQFGLKPIGDEEFEMAGNWKPYGETMYTYAAPIYVKGKDHLAVYMTYDEPSLKNYKIIGKLKLIQFNQK